jgi:two-component system OmpR family sensor kinase
MRKRWQEKREAHWQRWRKQHPDHDWHHEWPRHFDPFRHFPRSHPFFRKYLHFGLQRRLFLWFGATIVLSACVVGGMFRFFGSAPGWHPDRLRQYFGHVYAEVWNDPAARSALSETVVHDFDVGLRLKDTSGKLLEEHGAYCDHFTGVPVTNHAGETLGEVDVCWERPHSISLLFPIIGGLIVVWGASGFIARKISRPIHQLALVADEIGRGQLQSRIRIPRSHRQGEIRMLADALHDMATRIEKQLTDQRALLATVSHELRTPLARMRLLIELARGQRDSESGDRNLDGTSPASPERGRNLDEVDREIVGIDALVADLLANSRLDFAAIQPVTLDATEIAKQAIERTSIDPSKLMVEGDGKPLSFRGDPTLATRAIVNLLENAERHAGGVALFRVHRDGDFIAFDVEDDGPGFLPGEEARVFEPFYKNPRNPTASAHSMGLGLALVRRIVTAHGGQVYAENRSPSGARVGLKFVLIEP